MGEEFGVKWTGLNRDVPHAGGGIREPDLTLGGEETWPWRKGCGAWDEWGMRRKGCAIPLRGSFWGMRGHPETLLTSPIPLP